MMKKWLPIVLLTVLALVLIGIKTYPYLKNHFFTEETNQAQGKKSEEGSLTFDETKHRGFKEATFPFQNKEKKKLAEAYPDQFGIVQKMYYSWDFIDNAQGKYEIKYPDENKSRLYTFSVDLKNKKNRATYELMENGQVIETIHVLLKDGIATRQMPQKHIFTKEPIENNPRADADTLYGRYIGLFNSDITNSEWYILIEGNYEDWTYSEVEFLGMPAFLIKGTISKDKSETLAGPFTMTVSKETGALLDLKCYEENEKVGFSITVQNLSINKDIPDDIFVLDVNGNKEVDNTEFNLNGVGNSGEEKTGGEEINDD